MASLLKKSPASSPVKKSRLSSSSSESESEIEEPSARGEYSSPSQRSFAADVSDRSPKVIPRTKPSSKHKTIATSSKTPRNEDDSDTEDAPPLKKIKTEPKESESMENEWPAGDLLHLVTNLTKIVPANDILSYKTQMSHIHWDRVQFGDYSADQCKDKFGSILVKQRRYRTLTEILKDCVDWCKNPWQNNTKGKSGKPQKHPELPKKPLTPYFIYFMEKQKSSQAENLNVSMTDLSKLLSERYKALPDKKKNKYKQMYDEQCTVYKVEMEEFKKKFPDYYEQEMKNTSVGGGRKKEGPVKPKPPVHYFVVSKMEKHDGKDQAEKKTLEEQYRQQWKDLPDKKRVKYIQKSMEDEARYKDELGEYCVMHPNYKPDKSKSVLSKAYKDLKARAEGKPEKPPNSGYSYYSKIMLKQLTDVSNKERMGEISKRWKSLDEEARDAYNRKALVMNEEYQKQWTAYLETLPADQRLELEKKSRLNSGKRHRASPSTSSPKPPTANDHNADSSKVKKPISALFMFQQHKMESYKELYPEKNETEILRILGREFLSLPENQRELYTKKADEARKEAAEQSTSQSNRSVARRIKFPGEPKKPPQTGYSLFTSERLTQMTEVEPRQRMEKISKEWNGLDDSEKKVYKNRVSDMMAKYGKELEKFLSGLSSENKRLFLTQMKMGKKGNNPGNLSRGSQLYASYSSIASSPSMSARKSKSDSGSDEEYASSEDEDDSDQSGVRGARKRAVATNGKKANSSDDNAEESDSSSTGSGSGDESGDENDVVKVKKEPTSGSESSSSSTEGSSSSSEDEKKSSGSDSDPDSD